MNHSLPNYFVNYNAVYNKIIIAHPESLEKNLLVYKVSLPFNVPLCIILRYFFLSSWLQMYIYLYQIPIFCISELFIYLITGHLFLNTTEEPQTQQVKKGANSLPLRLLPGLFFFFKYIKPGGFFLSL